MPDELSNSTLAVYFEFPVVSQEKYGYPKFAKARYVSGWTSKLYLAQLRQRADVVWLEHQDGAIYRKVMSPYGNEASVYSRVYDYNLMQEFLILKLSSILL